jgi:hypothetical protein
MYPENKASLLKYTEEARELKEKCVKEFTSTAKGVARI